MFFTGFTRFSSEIQKINNQVDKKRKEDNLKKMYELVDEAEKILIDKNRDLDDFGRLLDYSWKLKKQTGKAISTSNIDILYERGIKAGALGGKLLGAGGGGFLLFYVQPENQDKLKEELKELLYIPFQFENEGTRILYYSPESCEPKMEEK